MSVDVCNIFRLADEIIVHIITFLPTIDRIAVSEVCERFRKVCCEKVISREANLSRCYCLSDCKLKSYLRPPLRCHNIQVLNLNYCYWLNAAVLGSLVKLKNLKELHVLECRITLVLLKRLLASMNLVALSWTWHKGIREVDLNVESTEPLQCSLKMLQRLTLQFTNVFQVSQIGFFLKFCHALEEFVVLQRHLSMCHIDVFSPRTALERGSFQVKLGNLRRLHIHLAAGSGICVESFAKNIVQVCADNISWEELWISSGGKDVLGKEANALMNSLSEMYEQKKLTLKDLAQVKALSLSGSSTVPSRIMRAANSPSGGLFVQDILSQPEQLKIQKLSLNSLRLTADTLHKLAQSCPNLELLSMKDCMLFDKVSEVLAGLSAVTKNCTNITSLNLSMAHIHTAQDNPCAVLANLKGLQELCLTACLIASPTQRSSAIVDVTMQGLVKPRRVGLASNLDVEALDAKESRLWVLTEGCPNMQKLEIQGLTAQSGCNEWCTIVGDADLICISKWKHLRRLTLTNLKGVHEGKFLYLIAQKCVLLECLKLQNLGITGACYYMFALLQALQYMRNLKDLSIYQYQMPFSAQFCIALETCTNLERFCFFSQYSSVLQNPQLIHEMVSKLNKLIVAYIFVALPMELCKNLQKSLCARFEKERPAFTAVVCNALKCLSDWEVFDQCPTVHIDEMWTS